MPEAWSPWDNSIPSRFRPFAAFSLFRTVEAVGLDAGGMEIRFDWRMARVVDKEGEVLDEMEWGPARSPSSLATRLGDLQSGRMSPEARALSARFPEAEVNHLGAMSDSSWPETTPNEAILFTEATAILARRGVAESAGDMDRRLDMLSSSSVELRASWTTQEARSVEWAGLFLADLDLDAKRSDIPGAIAGADSIVSVAKELGVKEPGHMPSEAEWDAMKSQAMGVVDISSTLESNEVATKQLAREYIPTLSLLVGPLGAARMVVLAGGRERLARMPSGSLQVLGATGAMAAHRRGAPPPKHSPILFSMPLVSRSPRWVRGKIARYLAGKCSIAVRVDHFDGAPWDEDQISEIHREAEAIRDRFPKPPKRG